MNDHRTIASTGAAKLGRIEVDRRKRTNMKNHTTIALLSLNLLVGCAREVEVKEEDKAPQVLRLELKENEKGADVLVLTEGGLPRLEQGSEGYNLYLCWVDEPAPPDGYPHEKRIELRGGSQGGGEGGGEGVRTIGLNAHLFEQGKSYYGRGRVCAIAVSDDRTYISNVVTVPEKPDAAATQADAAAMREVDEIERTEPPDKNIEISD